MPLPGTPIPIGYARTTEARTTEARTTNAPAGYAPTTSVTTAPTRPIRPPEAVPPRLLVVVVDRERASDTLDAAYSAARSGGQEVHTALLLPRPPLTLVARVRAERDRRADREARDLVTLAAQRAAAAGVQARIRLHRVGGRNDRDRRRIIDRTVTRLARRLDAVPVGWPAP